MQKTEEKANHIVISMSTEMSISSNSSLADPDDEFIHYEGFLYIEDDEESSILPKEIGKFRATLMPNLVFERFSNNEDARLQMSLEGKNLASLWEAMQENHDSLFGRYDDQMTSLLFIDEFWIDSRLENHDELALAFLKKILVQFKSIGRYVCVYASPILPPNDEKGSCDILRGITQELTNFYNRLGFEHLGETPFMAMSLDCDL